MKALEYAKELYQTFVPGTLSWLDPNNNKAFLDGQIVAHRQRDLDLLRREDVAGPEAQGDAKDINHCELPGRPGRPADRVQPVLQPDDLQVHEVSEGGEGIPALHDGGGAVNPVGDGVDRLRDAAAHRVREEPDLDRIPSTTPYRDSMKIMLPSGYAGKMGYASAGAIADFIIVNMVAEAASGSKTPKEAAERAQKRAERYYKV